MPPFDSQGVAALGLLHAAGADSLRLAGAALEGERALGLLHALGALALGADGAARRDGRPAHAAVALDALQALARTCRGRGAGARTHALARIDRGGAPVGLGAARQNQRAAARAVAGARLDVGQAQHLDAGAQRVGHRASVGCPGGVVERGVSAGGAGLGRRGFAQHAAAHRVELEMQILVVVAQRHQAIALARELAVAQVGGRRVEVLVVEPMLVVVIAAPGRVDVHLAAVSVEGQDPVIRQPGGVAAEELAALRDGRNRARARVQEHVARAA